MAVTWQYSSTWYLLCSMVPSAYLAYLPSSFFMMSCTAQHGTAGHSIAQHIRAELKHTKAEHSMNRQNKVLSSWGEEMKRTKEYLERTRSVGRTQGLETRSES